MLPSFRTHTRATMLAMALTLAGVSTGRAEPPDAPRHETPARTIEISDAGALQHLLAEPQHNVHIRLASGDYRLSPAAHTDPTCGNCPDPSTEATTTVGLRITGRNITLSGPPDHSAIIHTGAGYGLLIDRADNITVEHLTLTGGVRSDDGNATDGAIVVKDSSATIRANRIVDNIGDPETVRRTVSGVMGIVGREGSNIHIIGNHISRNSWDGIALYRQARAVIEDNIVDGVDKAAGPNIGGGRGVGIGVTWDATAEIRGNLVTRYWKGIGLFVNASGTVEHNIVEDIITWGISLWDAGGGEPRGIIRNNAVYRTGACGLALTLRTSDNPGELTGNAIARTGQDQRYDPPDRYCFQCALAIHRKPEAFTIDRNIFFANRRGADDLPDHDVPEAEFRAAAAPLLHALSGRPALVGAAFLNEFSTAPRDSSAGDHR
jgi:parallel beta-helix repeat protein